MGVYLAIVGVIASLSGAVILASYLDRRCCGALEEEAQRLGFSFAKVAKPFDGSSTSELAVCLHESSSVEVEKLMQGTMSGRRVLVFNVRSCNRWGEGAAVTTFAAFQSSSGQLPVFKIRAKNVIERCLGAFVRNAGDSDTDPEFAKRFLLQCSADDARMHKFFTSNTMRHLLQRADHFKIQSSPNWLLIFRPCEMIRARNLRQFVHATSAIALGLLGPEIQPW